MKPAFVLIKGKIIIKKGTENIYLPAKAMIRARIIEITIIEDLIPLEIFLLDVRENQFKNI